jgi:hypothetical protein
VLALPVQDTLREVGRRRERAGATEILDENRGKVIVRQRGEWRGHVDS